jgi:hypothetical protein
MRAPTLFDAPPPAASAGARADKLLDVAHTARRVNAGKGLAMIHPCGRCGAANAPFGFGVYLRQALATGSRAKAGKWLCRSCMDGVAG